MTRSKSEVSHHGRRSSDFRNFIWRMHSRVCVPHRAAAFFHRTSQFIPAPWPDARRGEEAIRRISLYTHRRMPLMTAIFPRTRSLTAAISENFAHSEGKADGEQCSRNVAQAAAAKSPQQMTKIICRFAKNPDRHPGCFSAFSWNKM